MTAKKGLRRAGIRGRRAARPSGDDREAAILATFERLLAERPLIYDAPAAYVCRGYVCDRPVTTPEALTAQL